MWEWVVYVALLLVAVVAVIYQHPVLFPRPSPQPETASTETASTAGRVSRETAWNGEVAQELFAWSVSGWKEKGTFLELGASDAIYHSNTYLLEKMFGWRGILVEIDPKMEEQYVQQRSKSSRWVLQDARTLNYVSLLQDTKMPKQIDYLQIDLDVDGENSTMAALQNLAKNVFPKWRFKAITFEHDHYHVQNGTREQSRRIFADFGYILLFQDIDVGPYGQYSHRAYEDWWVDKDCDPALLKHVRGHPRYKATGLCNRDDVVSILSSFPSAQ